MLIVARNFGHTVDQFFNGDVAVTTRIDHLEEVPCLFFTDHWGRHRAKSFGVGALEKIDDNVRSDKTNQRLTVCAREKNDTVDILTW